jgi:hypothetical protein
LTSKTVIGENGKGGCPILNGNGAINRAVTLFQACKIAFLFRKAQGLQGNGEET